MVILQFYASNGNEDYFLTSVLYSWEPTTTEANANIALKKQSDL